MAQTVRDVMTTPPRTVGPQSTLREAAVVMRDNNIGDVLVAEDSRLIGVVTDRDVVVRCIADGADCTTETVGSAHSGRLVTVRPDTDVDEAVRIMREHTVRRLPVVDNDQLVGVVSIGDFAVEQDPRSALADISAAAPNA